MASQITCLIGQMVWTWLQIAFAVDPEGSHGFVVSSSPLVSFGAGDGQGPSQSASALEAAIDDKITSSLGNVVSFGSGGVAGTSESTFVTAGSSVGAASSNTIATFVGSAVSFGHGDGPGIFESRSSKITLSSSPLVSFGTGDGPGISEVPPASERLQAFSVLQLQEAKTELIGPPLVSQVQSTEVSKVQAVASISASSQLKSFRGFGTASGHPVTTAPAFASAADDEPAQLGRSGYAMMLEVREVQLAILLLVTLFAVCSAKVFVPCLIARPTVSAPKDDPLGYIFKVKQLDNHYRRVWS